MRLCHAIAAAAILLSACSSDRTARKNTDADSAKVAQPTTDSLGRPLGHVDRPALMNRTIRIEGNPEIHAFDLLKNPAGMPLPFSTYKPQEMQVASMTLSGVSTLTLTPMFGAKTDPDAYVQVIIDTVPPAANDPAGAAITAVTAGQKLSALTTSPIDIPWSAGSRSFTYTKGGRKLAGSMIVGRHGKYTYRFFTQYPVEFADGMAARLRDILNQWRWEDDYTYLVPSGPMPPKPDTTVALPTTQPKK